MLLTKVQGVLVKGTNVIKVERTLHTNAYSLDCAQWGGLTLRFEALLFTVRLGCALKSIDS